MPASLDGNFASKARSAPTPVINQAVQREIPASEWDQISAPVSAPAATDWDAISAPVQMPAVHQLASQIKTDGEQTAQSLSRGAIKMREAGRSLVREIQDNGDGSMSEVYVVKQTAPASKLTAGEKTALIQAHRAQYAGVPIEEQQQDFGQMQGQIRAATAADNTVMQNFGGAAADTLAHIGTGIVGTVAPQTANDLNAGLGYTYDAESKAALAGQVTGNLLPLIPSLMAGGAPVLANVTAGTLGASQFGSVRTDIARRRQQGENIPVANELVAAGLSALAEFAGERIGLNAMVANKPMFVNKIGQSIANYATSIGVNATEEMVTQLAQNAVDRYIAGNANTELASGVPEAGLMGGLIGGIGHGVHHAISERVNPQSLQREQPAAVTAEHTPAAEVEVPSVTEAAPSAQLETAAGDDIQGTFETAAEPDADAAERLASTQEETAAPQEQAETERRAYEETPFVSRDEAFQVAKSRAAILESSVYVVKTEEGFRLDQRKPDSGKVVVINPDGSMKPLDLAADTNKRTIADERRQKSLPDRATSEDMLNYIKSKNTGEMDVEATRQLLGNTEYVKQDVPLDQIGQVRGASGINAARAKEFAGRPATSSPPIVLGQDGRPVDGKHRFVAAKARGDKTISAYVPVNSKFVKASAPPVIATASAPGTVTPNLPPMPSAARGWTMKQMKFWADKNGYDTTGSTGVLTLRRSIRAQQAGKTYTPRKSTVDAIAQSVPAVQKSIAKATPIDGTQHKRHLPRGIEEFITPISSRIRDISPRMFDRLMRMEFDTGVSREALKRDLLPEAQKLTDALGGKESAKYAEFKADVLNGDFDAAQSRLPDSVKDSFKAFKTTFKNLLDQQTAAGVKIGDLGDNYWPRFIKDYAAFSAEFGDKKGQFEEAFDLARRVKGRLLTAEEKAEVANSVLSGFGPRKPGSYGPANARERRIEKLTPEQVARYIDPFEAAFRYVDSSTYAAQRSKFLGRNHDLNNLEDTIGPLVRNETEAGKLMPDQQQELAHLMHVRFTADTTMLSKTARHIKQFMYLTSLSQFRSALNQTLDLAVTATSHGLASAVQGVKAAIGLMPHDRRLIMEDIGLHDHGEEFKDVSRIARVTDRALSITGFKMIDRFGKETRINAAWDAMSKAAKATDSPAFKRLERDYRPVLGDKFESTLRDIRDGKKTEDARYLLFLDLAKVQPVVMSQMPEKYLKMRDGRILYTMKTFTLNQLDFLRRDILRKLSTPGQRAEGLRTLSAFAVLTTLIGVGKDLIQDLIRGKQIDADELPDRSVNALLGVVGLNSYTVQKAMTSPTDAALNLISPPLSWINNGWNDVRTMGDGSGFRSVQSIPVVGDLFYYWAPFGKGFAKKAEDAKADYKDKLNALRREAYLARQSGDRDTARQLLGIYNDRRKEGAGDGRKTPLTFEDLMSPPPGSDERKVQLTVMKQRAKERELVK